MAVFKSAKNAKVRIFGQTVAVKQWTVEYTAVEIDVTNSEGGGFTDRITGCQDGKITMELDFDSGGLPYGLATAITPGATGAILAYVNDTTGPNWNFPSAVILTVPNKNDIKQGAVGGTITAANKGTFSPPTGTF